MAFVELEDSRIHYRMRGRGEPLVLVAGLGATLDTWNTLVPSLDDTFTVIRFDNRGIGRSVARRRARTLRDYSCDVCGLLNHLGYERAHVLGLSLGGMITQQFALDFPDRLHRLVLLATCNRFSPYLREMMKLMGVLLRRGRGYEFRDALTTLGVSPSFIDAHPEVHERVRRLAGPGNRLAVAAQLRAITASALDRTASGIQAETFLVGGTLDVLIPFCYVEQLAGEIERARLLPIEGAGHALLDEAPDTVIPALTAFLRNGLEGAVR